MRPSRHFDSSVRVRALRATRGARSCAVALAVALAAGCGRPGPGAPARSVADLELALARAARIELHAASDSLAQLAAPGVRTLARRTGVPVEIVTRGQRGAHKAPRIVLGTFDDPAVAALLERMGASREDDGHGAVRHLYQGVALGRAGDVVQASFEDPLRPGLPVALLAGGSAESLAPLLLDLRIPARPAARVIVAGEAQLELLLAPDGAPRPATRRELGQAARAERHRMQPVEGAARGIFARRVQLTDTERIAEHLAAVRRARAALAEFAEVDAAELPPLTISYAAGAEDLLAWTGRAALAAPSALVGSIAVLVHPGVPDDGGAEAARETALALLGAPADAWLLDGAAVDAAGSWWGRPLERAAGGPARLLPPVAEIADAAAIDRHSMHVLAPARGLLFRFLRERRGSAALRAAWRGDGAALELEGLDGELRGWAGALAPDAPARAPRPFERASLVRGFAVDSRMSPGGAVASEALQRSFAKVARTGADALSFTSYACVRPWDPVHPGGRLPWGLESVEGDAALAAAIATARLSGLSTLMLQPKLVATDGGGPWGARKYSSIDHWEEFFAGCEPWLVHYALLADLGGCDLLCIGTELVPPLGGPRLQEAVRAYHAERWRESIGRARALFGGALTYAARWPLEASAVPFWEELDAVGVTFYPDLPGPSGMRLDDQPLERQLRGELAELAEFAQRHGRPALLAEVGFRSTRYAATESRVGPGESDLAEQARIFAAFERAFGAARRDSPALAGLFVWKLELDPHVGSGAARSFSPTDKPAEAHLRRLFRGD